MVKSQHLSGVGLFVLYLLYCLTFLKIDIMATEIKVVSGLLVIGDKFSLRTDQFTVQKNLDGIRISSTVKKQSYVVLTKDAKIGSTTYTDSKVLFLAVAALSAAPAGGGA